MKTKEITFNTKEERTAAYQKYTPLAHKIANQFIGKLPSTPEDILAYAVEGLVIAMNTYNPSKPQSFLQYAAYQMRYNILSMNNREGTLIRIPRYAQQKKYCNGKNDISVTMSCEDIKETAATTDLYSYNSNEEHNQRMSMFYKEIESKFSKRDSEMFYRFYGLKDYNEEKGIAIAKRFNLSTASVSVIIKRICKYIREHDKISSLLYIEKN